MNKCKETRELLDSGQLAMRMFMAESVLWRSEIDRHMVGLVINILNDFGVFEQEQYELLHDLKNAIYLKVGGGECPAPDVTIQDRL